MDWETYLLMASVLFLLVGQILIVVQAVQVEAIWGFVVFIVPFAAPIFVMLHWRETKVPFFFWLAGSVSIVVSAYGHAAHVAALVILVGAAVRFMVREYKQTGTVFYGPKSDTELDLDSQGRVLDLATPDDSAE